MEEKTGSCQSESLFVWFMDRAPVHIEALQIDWSDEA